MPQTKGRSARSVDPARAAAYDLLAAVRERDAYANLTLPSLLTERRLSGRDAAFATELGYGTLRALSTLDAIIARCIDRPITELDPSVSDLLRLGVYQLLRMRVPPHAAVSVTVDLARVRTTDGPAKFVNAVLRRVSERDLDQWLAEVLPDRIADPIGYLALRHAHPAWIVRAFADALGGDDAELDAALAADDAPGGTHLVARPGRVSREQLVAESGGRAGRFSPYAVYLDGGDPGRLTSVRSGAAGVQDEGSQLAAQVAATAPVQGTDAHWLDLCAGPGGKAALLGALAAQRGAQLTAVELHEHRAELVRAAVAGLPVQVLVGDARAIDLHDAAPQGFDRVLLDAPCSGLGALRRRPEARWRHQPGDLPALTALQRELLTAALGLVRPGGVLTYVTCSPHLAETAGVLASVTSKHPCEPVDVRALLPAMPQLGAGPSVQLWPHRHGTDAMFLAALRRS